MSIKCVIACTCLPEFWSDEHIFSLYYASIETLVQSLSYLGLITVGMRTVNESITLLQCYLYDYSSIFFNLLVLNKILMLTHNTYECIHIRTSIIYILYYISNPWSPLFELCSCLLYSFLLHDKILLNSGVLDFVN